MLVKGKVSTATWYRQTVRPTSVCIGTALLLDMPIVISIPFVNGTVTQSAVANDLAIDVRKKPTTNNGKLSHTHVCLLFVVCRLCLCCENESTRCIQ